MVFGLCGALLVLSSSAAVGQESSSRQSLIFPYEQRVTSMDEQRSTQMANTPEEIPPGFEPWWSQYQERSLWDFRGLTVDVASLVLGAMRHSPHIQLISLTPEIAKTDIAEANATFDPTAFLESKFIRTSDPVGSMLTTGNLTSDRFRDQNWYSNGGIRRKTEWGGKFEASQRFGFEDNNSLYYLLLPQGTSKLTLSYTQPILNGAGRAYNESIIVLAEIDATIACDQFADDLQEHLLAVNEAYWNLYLERVLLLQRRRLLKEAEDILNELDARRKLDASEGQIVRAKSAVETRRADIILSEAAVHDAEAKIHQLVNDPQLLLPERAELIPIQHPNLQLPNVGVRDSLITALYNRPDINKKLEEIRKASLNEKIATKDLLPVLDAVLNLYTSGLEGNSRMDKSFVDQFSVGEPGYTAGLMFEVPIGNCAAKARLLKRQVILRQFSLLLKQKVLDVVVQIEDSVRAVNTSFSVAQAQYLAMKAADTEVKYIEERWRLLPSEDQVAGIVLEDLLEAQDRLARAEFDFAKSQVGYNVFLARLNRDTGMLVKCMPQFQADQSAPTPSNGIKELPPTPKSGGEEMPPPPPEVTSLKLTPSAPLPPVTEGATSMNKVNRLPQSSVK